MGPIWGRQDPGRLHVGPMNFAVWGGIHSCAICSYSPGFVTGTTVMANSSKCMRKTPRIRTGRRHPHVICWTMVKLSQHFAQTQWSNHGRRELIRALSMHNISQQSVNYAYVWGISTSTMKSTQWNSTIFEKYRHLKAIHIYFVYIDLLHQRFWFPHSFAGSLLKGTK